MQERQTLYAIACVKWLRTHYTDEQQRPLPLVLVGHSMGGVVVRAAAVAVEADSSLRECHSFLHACITCCTLDKLHLCTR